MFPSGLAVIGSPPTHPMGVDLPLLARDTLQVFCFPGDSVSLPALQLAPVIPSIAYDASCRYGGLLPEPGDSLVLIAPCSIDRLPIASPESRAKSAHPFRRRFPTL